MTPEQLRDAVTVVEGRLDVALDQLATGAAAAYLRRLLPGGRVVLREAVRSEIDDGVRVSGVGDAAPFAGMSVDLRLTTSAVVIDASGDEAWSFASAFHGLAGSFFDGLAFQRPTWHIDSTAITSADDAAASFTGALVMNTRLALLDLLFPGAARTVSGTVGLVAGLPGVEFETATVPMIVLSGQTADRADLGPFTVEGLRYEIYGVPRFNYYVTDFEVESYLRVLGTIPFTTKSRRHDVEMSIDVSPNGERVLLEADFRDVGRISLAEVAALTGLDGLAVPFDLNVTSPVLLTDLRVLLTPTAPEVVDSVRVALETDERWDIIPGLLTLQRIDLLFRVDLTLPPGHRLAGTVSGLVAIGRTGTLEIGASFANRTLAGGLREGDGPLHIREVYEHFLRADAGHLPDITVRAFQFSVTLPGADQRLAYGGQISLDANWPIADHLVLHDVGFVLDHRDDATTFTATAGFDIGWTTVEVSAGYDPAPGMGWTFAGATGPGVNIPLGGLIESLGLALPAPLAGLTAGNLAVRFTTGTRALFLTAEVRFPVDTAELDLTVTIDTAQRLFTGTLTATVDGTALSFDVRFADDPTTPRFVAAFRRAQDGPVPTVKELIAALNPAAARFVPDGIAIDLRDALFAFDRAGPATAAYIVAVDLAIAVDLSRLPLVGERLAGAGTVGVDPLRLVAVSAPLPAARVSGVNALLPAGIAPLPAADLAAGFTVDAALRLGTLTQMLSLPSPSSVAPPASVPGQPPSTSDNVVWYKVQRAFGPLTFDRIGFAYQRPPGGEAELAFLLDASLNVAGLALVLDGLAVRVALADPAALPAFSLRGLGLSYASGDVAISAAFLSDTVEYEGRTLTAYSGRAVLRTSQFTLGALGSYAQLPQGPSLFVYAFLNYPLGGPPIFYVEGLSAGFGYNRRLVAPEVSDVASFPLVAEAAGTRAAAVKLADEMRALRDYLPPSPGDFFLAAGVRFTSFRMVDSVVLLAVSFGHRFEVDVLGLSTMVFPSPDAASAGVTPLAKVQLALRASLVPDEGYLAIRAQLTSNSYLLAPECRLTGGFAFQAWFGREHTGDFVLSFGGYHPRFRPPAHYPAVPRLGFSWQVSNTLAMKGAAYFALTPSMLMAGASFTATWNDGAAKAWFSSSMDFLIGWKPFHYEADIQVAAGVEYTFHAFGTHTIRAAVSARVNLWGPEFSARATVHIGAFSVTLSCGQDTNTGPRPIEWPAFRESFLPAADAVVTVVLQDGAVTGGESGHLGVVNPVNLVLRTDSAIPSSRAWRGPETGGQALDTEPAATAFGVAPLGRTDPVVSVQRIEITRSNGTRADDRFRFEPVTKHLPAAMWGDRLRPSVTDPSLVENLLTGYAIRPLPPTEPAVSVGLPAEALRSTTPVGVRPDPFRWLDLPPPRASTDTPEVRGEVIGETISAPDAAAARAAMASAVFPGEDWILDLGAFDVADFLAVPQVEVTG